MACAARGITPLERPWHRDRPVGRDASSRKRRHGEPDSGGGGPGRVMGCRPRRPMPSPRPWATSTSRTGRRRQSIPTGSRPVSASPSRMDARRQRARAIIPCLSSCCRRSLSSSPRAPGRRGDPYRGGPASRRSRTSARRLPSGRARIRAHAGAEEKRS